MAQLRRSVFLERSSYRRRRARDASRLLPVFGLLVFLIPGLWETNQEGGIELSSAMIFLFVFWWLLIGIAASLSRYLSDSVVGESDQPEQNLDS